MPTESSPGGERRGAQSGKDRRSPHTSIGPDGTLIFGDRHGGRWHVYDRRSGDRRGGKTFGDSSQFYRVFVNDAGEEWRYALRAEEIIDDTAFALERQLALAVRVERDRPS